MSLHAALRYMDHIGVRECTVIPDHDPAFATITTDKTLTRGQAAILTSRMRMAILEHRRALSESADVLDEPWSVQRNPGGGVLLAHPSCRLLSLPQYKAAS